MTENNTNAAEWAALDPQLGDDRAMFSAARVRELVSADRARAPRSLDEDTLARLRRVLALMGLGSAVPDEDGPLSGVLFSVFGMMAGVLERREAFLTSRDPDEIRAAFKKFAKPQGYDLTTCAEKDSISTEGGLSPATFWTDATEHAWRGWANRPGAEDYRDRAYSAERGCSRAGLLFDPATREWMPPARHPTLAEKIGNKHRFALRIAEFGACTCLTKTPELRFHRADCRYRLFGEIEHALFGPSAAQRVSGPRSECTPKNGGASYIIDRAPDSWELRECEIRPLEDGGAAADDTMDLMRRAGLNIWVEQLEDDIPVAISFGVLRKIIGAGRRPAAHLRVDQPALDALKPWEPQQGEQVSVCMHYALARAISLLVSMGREDSADVAARLAYLTRQPAALLDEKPDNGLLASMATCLNHGFGLMTAKQQEAMLYDMRKLYDEVAGRGYYRESNRSFYLQWLSPTIDGGERANRSEVDHQRAIPTAAKQQDGGDGKAQ